MTLLIRTLKTVDEYRGSRITQTICFDGHEFEIDGYLRSIIEFSDKWWIAPLMSEDDDIVDPIGPFDTPELAWSTLKLLS